MMKKIIATIVILLSIPAFATNWFVSQSAGTAPANGSDWTHKAALSSFSWAGVSAGDTVFIDGLTDSLTYSTRLIPTKSGTSGNKIIISRDWRAGHNGKPIFIGLTSGESGIIAGYNYTEFNGLYSKYGGDASVYVTGDYNDFIGCTVLTNGTNHSSAANGFEVRGDYTRILYCTVYTGIINVAQETDLIWFDEGRDIEIGYCTLRMENTNTNSGYHKDVIQQGNVGWQTSGGMTKIHHNFLFSNGDPDNGWNSCIYMESSAGDYLIYDNVIVSIGSSGSGCSMTSPDCGNNPKFSIKLYNNTFYIGDLQSTMNLAGADTAIIKNNIVYKPTSREDSETNEYPWGIMLGSGSSPYRDIDYNYYVIESTSIFSWENECGSAGQRTFSGWQSAYGVDAHSYATTTAGAITFVGTLPSRTLSDYALTSGSDGIAQGTNLSSIFSDDVNGDTRPATWDMGAINYGVASVDTIPLFSFTALNNMELDTAYVGSSTFSGADSTFTVYTTTGARFNINSSGSLSTTPKTAINGDVVYVETVTGSSYSTGYSETIIAGGVSQSFTVTTKAEPIVPSGEAVLFRGSDGILIKDANGIPIKVKTQ